MGSEGFHITAVTTKKLTLSEAKDFYEVYNGVVKEYSYLIEQLLAGSVIALQIECNSDNKENAPNKQQPQSAASSDAEMDSTAHSTRKVRSGPSAEWSALHRFAGGWRIGIEILFSNRPMKTEKEEVLFNLNAH